MMKQVEFARAKEAFEDDRQVTRPLLDELGTVARFLIRNGHLPASYAPYGQWDQEAGEELLGEWVAEKLLSGEGGGLAALFDSARTAKSFRALAQRSLRQFVLNRRERSQSQNLYDRAKSLLGSEERFVVVQDAARPQDVVWGLGADPPRAVFPGGERELGAFAYSLGDFELIRYKDTAAKLAPLLSSEELIRFTEGMIAAAGPLTLSALMLALELRFDLAPVTIDSLQSDRPPEPVTDLTLEEEVVLREIALASISELTARQSRVLLARRAEVTVETLAEELDCSVGTVANEEKAIARVLRRHCADPEEEAELLKMAGDLLYEGSVGDE
jgi:DNA-binding CsgD family transcriptional regulator